MIKGPLTHKKTQTYALLSHLEWVKAREKKLPWDLECNIWSLLLLLFRFQRLDPCLQMVGVSMGEKRGVGCAWLHQHTQIAYAFIYIYVQS